MKTETSDSVVFDVSVSLCFFGFDIVTNVDLDKNGFKFAINACRTQKNFPERAAAFAFRSLHFIGPGKVYNVV